MKNLNHLTKKDSSIRKLRIVENLLSFGVLLSALALKNYIQGWYKIYI